MTMVWVAEYPAQPGRSNRDTLTQPAEGSKDRIDSPFSSLGKWGCEAVFDLRMEWLLRGGALALSQGVPMLYLKLQGEELHST
jgi:hypothetical protein